MRIITQYVEPSLNYLYTKALDDTRQFFCLQIMKFKLVIDFVKNKETNLTKLKLFLILV